MIFSGINFVHFSIAFWYGCVHCSPGCANCWAQKLLEYRLHLDTWGASEPRRRASLRNRNRLFALNKHAVAKGYRPRVFVNHMSDVGDVSVPQEWVAELFEAIALCPALDVLLLTKRPENLLRWSAELSSLANVWLGVSVESQRYADIRIPILSQLPAKIKWVSAEPLLGPVSLSQYLDQIQWVVAGGESGGRFRPMNVDWARELRDECVARKVPYWFKQYSGGRPKLLGRLLDGQEWSQVPQSYTHG